MWNMPGASFHALAFIYQSITKIVLQRNIFVIVLGKMICLQKPHCEQF